MLLLTVRRNNLLSDRERFHGIFVIPTDRSALFCRNPRRDVFPACVPKGRFVVVGGSIKRVGLMCPDEFWAGQQMSFGDFMGSDRDRFTEIANNYSYSSLIRFGGNAFHVGSAGHFTIAQLMLFRFADFGFRASA